MCQALGCGNVFFPCPYLGVLSNHLLNFSPMLSLGDDFVPSSMDLHCLDKDDLPIWGRILCTYGVLLIVTCR